MQLRQDWINEFAASLSAQFKTRYEYSENGREISEFIHAHSKWYVKSQLTTLNAHILEDAFTCVVDLSEHESFDQQQYSIELGFAGCGFVYILPLSMRKKVAGLQEQAVLRRLEDRGSVGDFV
jgi:hypothetical protein